MTEHRLNVEAKIRRVTDNAIECSRGKKPDYLLIDHDTLKALWAESDMLRIADLTVDTMYSYCGMEIVEFAAREERIEVSYKVEGLDG